MSLRLGVGCGAGIKEEVMQADCRESDCSYTMTAAGTTRHRLQANSAVCNGTEILASLVSAAIMATRVQVSHSSENYPSQLGGQSTSTVGSATKPVQSGLLRDHSRLQQLDAAEANKTGQFESSDWVCRHQPVPDSHDAELVSAKCLRQDYDVSLWTPRAGSLYPQSREDGGRPKSCDAAYHSSLFANTRTEQDKRSRPWWPLRSSACQIGTDTAAQICHSRSAPRATIGAVLGQFSRYQLCGTSVRGLEC